MISRCINTACVENQDTCTDRNCPERLTAVTVPPEVVNGATALITISYTTAQSHRGFSMRLPGKFLFTSIPP